MGEEGQERTKELPSSSVTQTGEAACTNTFSSQIQGGEEITWDHMLHNHLYDPSHVTWHFHVYEKDVMRDGRIYTTIHL